MPRKLEERRNRQINIRVTDADHARLSLAAQRANMKLTSFCELRILRPNGKIEFAQTMLHKMDPALFAELRRIGNNLNQVAHALNGGLPPHVMFAARTLSELMNTLLRDELLARRIEALRTRTHPNGAPPSETGVKLQGRLRVYPARRRQDHRR
jgi:Bacterial mobilisation protein (MobC)